MSKKIVGRPSKINKEAMNEANVWFMVVMVMLLILLSVSFATIINPEMVDMIKASLANLFK